MCPPYLDSMLTEYWVWWYNGPRSFCEILGFIQNIFHHPVERVVLWTSTQNERIGMLGVSDQVHQKDSCIIFHVSQYPSCSARTLMVWLWFLWLSKEWKIISFLKCLFFFWRRGEAKGFLPRLFLDFAPQLIHKMMHRLLVKVLRDYKKNHDNGIDTPIPNDYME